MTKAGRIVGALLLAGASLPAWGQPAPAPVLADADLLYCARAYAEGATLLKGDPDPGVRRSANDARIRAGALVASDSALLAEHPDRHQRASTQAQQRLAALPAAPLEARRLALRAAYVECRYLQTRNGGATTTAAVPAAGPAATPVVVPIPLPVAVSAPAPLAVPVAVASSAPTVGAVSVPVSTPPLVSASPPQPAPARVFASVAQTAPVPASLPTSVGRPGTTERQDAPSLPRTGASPAAAPPLIAAAMPEPAAPSKPRKGAATRPAPAATASVPGPVADKSPLSGGLADADLLYCTQVYGEVVSTFSDDTGEAAVAARDARERWLRLSAREHDLLNDHPDRHSLASAAARQRLRVLPEQAGRARSMVLRTAYEDCLSLESRAATAGKPAPGGDRLQMLAKRNFCRDLLMRKLRISPKVRATFSPSELAALDEIQKIGDALAQPLPGPPLTLEQDREANQLARQLRDSLDRAAAEWSDGPDPVAQAFGKCHDDYARGLLGGPDVLSPPAEALPTPVTTEATPALARPPVVRMADLGPVFHMREVTPAGNIDGIWIRRGRTNLYDGIWVQASNGQMQRDVLELRGIVDGELTLYRQGYRGTYRAKVRPDGTLEPGTASWFNSDGYAWAALPSQYVRGGDLGALVHMREVTPHGNYDGIWRQRGQTGVYDVLWVFLPTGEITTDVLAVSGIAKGQLIIQRQNGPALYSFKRRADTPRAGSAGKGGLSKWVVLPAQPVKLGGAAR